MSERTVLVTGYDYRGLPFARYEREWIATPSVIVGRRMKHITTVERPGAYRTRCGLLLPIRTTGRSSRTPSDAPMCPRCEAKRTRDLARRAR